MLMKPHGDAVITLVFHPSRDSSVFRLSRHNVAAMNAYANWIMIHGVDQSSKTARRNAPRRAARAAPRRMRFLVEFPRRKINSVKYSIEHEQFAIHA